MVPEYDQNSQVFCPSVTKTARFGTRGYTPQRIYQAPYYRYETPFLAFRNWSILLFCGLEERNPRIQFVFASLLLCEHYPALFPTGFRLETRLQFLRGLGVAMRPPLFFCDADKSVD